MMTNNAKAEQIFDLIIDKTGIPPQRFDSNDIFLGNGLGGDDAFEFIQDFAEKFGVSLDGYRWYFHHGEEGFNWGGIFFKPPHDRVIRIPVTLENLIDAANTGRWMIEYPAYRLPKVRNDTRFNVGCSVVFVLLLVSLAFRSAID